MQEQNYKLILLWTQMQKSKHSIRKPNSTICKRRMCYDHVGTLKKKHKNGITWQDTNTIHHINRLGSRKHIPSSQQLQKKQPFKSILIPDKILSKLLIEKHFLFLMNIIYIKQCLIVEVWKSLWSQE